MVTVLRTESAPPIGDGRRSQPDRLLVAFLLAPWLILVLGLGGFAPGILLPAMLCMVAAAVVAAWRLPQHWRPPLQAWVWILLLPMGLQALLMALPLGWGHPWTAPDRQALGVAAAGLALDVDRAAVAAAWAFCLCALALMATCALRGGRGRVALQAMVVIGALHALGGILLAALWPDLQSPFYSGRVRGAFVYPNHAAAHWASLLPAALFLAASSPRPGRWWLAVLALGIAVVLTASRGGLMVAALVTAPWWWLALPPRRRWLWALGGIVALAALLSALNLDPVRARFASWQSPLDTLEDGRMGIWRDALPSIAEAGALGAGPGSTMMAWRRHGSAQFGSASVDHLHQDTLQWLLERGPLGLGLLLLGMALVAWLAWKRWPAARQRHGPMLAAALGGVAVLLLHGGIDLIWRSPALVVQALLLLAVGAALLAPAQGVRPSRWSRGSLLMVALIAGLACWWVAPTLNEHGLVTRTERIILLREQSGRDPYSHPAVERILDMTVQTGELARLQAGLAMARFRALEPSEQRPDHPLLSRAQRALAVSAERSPGSAGAWIERLRLAIHEAEPAHTIDDALDGLRRWGPQWLPTQLARVEVAAFAAERVAPQVVEEALRGVLAAQHAPPPFLPELAERHLGISATSQALIEAPGVVARSGVSWAQRRATVEDWLRIRAQAHPNPWRVPLAAWSVAPHLPHGVVLRWDRDEATRQRQALSLTVAGLPLPPDRDLDAVGQQLVEALQTPARRLVSDGDLRQSLREVAGARQHHHLGRILWQRLSLAETLARGQVPERVPPANHSDLLAAALDLELANGQALMLILRRHRHLEWRALPGGGVASWWWQDEATTQDPDQSLPEVRIDGWAALIHNGEFVRWVRDQTPVSAGLAPGLHRIVIVQP